MQRMRHAVLVEQCTPGELDVGWGAHFCVGARTRIAPIRAVSMLKLLNLIMLFF